MNSKSKKDKLKLSDHYWKKNANLFSNIYSTKDILLLPNKLFLKQRMSVIQEYINHDKNATVLDMGCGSGEFANMLANYYGQVAAVDYSQIMIDLAQQGSTKKNIIFYKADCTQTTIDSHSIDHIFSLGLMDYVQDVDKVFDEFTRLLKKGGGLVFTIPKSPSLFAPLRWSTRIREKLFKIPPIVNSFSIDEVEQILNKYNLQKVDVTSLWTTMWIIRAKQRS
jgi:ubiquinone/menaquinone biosynthesis C-methylase UbiE